MRWMIYGANGYTGRLLAESAVRRGSRPILAGRAVEKIRPLAREIGLDYRVFPLDRADLREIAAVVHVAGPFSATSRPMVDACLAARVHYLDITGEIDVFEAVLSRDAEARAAGVVLMPGVGFDVVPTDCLAAMLRERLPDATHLELAFDARGKASAGTAKTALEGLATGGRARIDGVIRSVPAAWKERDIPFPHGTRHTVTIPWGDVSSAWYSTRIPNICVYMSMPRAQVRWVRRMQTLASILRRRTIRSVLQRFVGWATKGPTAEERDRAFNDVWGEVRNASGRRESATLTTPDGYALTAESALRAVTRVAAGEVKPGAWTPSMAFGPNYVFELPGVTSCRGI